MENEEKNVLDPSTLTPPELIGKSIFVNPIDDDVFSEALGTLPRKVENTIFNTQDRKERFIKYDIPLDSSETENISEFDYYSSDERLNTYKEVSTKDKLFYKYIKGYYGSEDNFFKFNSQLNKIKTYDPSEDYQAEIVIITKEKIYKADFISPLELLLETMSGICTVDYFKLNGMADRLVCTLSEELIPDAEEDVRYSAFGSIGRKRLIVWNLLKGKWSSFYVPNLIRFVRDETSGIE